jgi:WD40-like Beta Propeller Repeat
MSFFSFFHRWRSELRDRNSRHVRKPRRRQFQPGLELLEGRTLPSIQAISVVPGAAPATGNGDSWLPAVNLNTTIFQGYQTNPGIGRTIPDASHAVSADGRDVVFESAATNLAAGQSNGMGLFLRDQVLGTTTLLSGSASPSSNEAVISADGSEVAFTASTGAGIGVFVFNVASGTLTQIPFNTTTFPHSDDVEAISADGNTIAYVDSTTLFVTGSMSTWANLYLYNRLTGVNTEVPTPAPFNPGASISADATLSADGRYICYVINTPADESAPPYLANSKVYLYDSVANTTTLVSQPASGANQGGCNAALISGDGNFIVYTSTATNLVPGQVDPSGGTSVYLYNRLTGSTTLVSHASGSSTTTANGNSDTPLVSADGRYVYYESTATNLVPGQAGSGGENVYAYDSVAGTTLLVSHISGAAGTTASGASSPGAISSDGRFLAYESSATNLVPGQVNGNAGANVFLYDLSTDSSKLVNAASTAPPTTGNGGVPTTSTSSGLPAVNPPTISANGSTVVFTSEDSNLVPGDSNGKADVFAATGANLASFQVPALARGTYQYDSAGGPWTFSGHAGLASNGSAFTSSNPNAPEGTQVAFVQDVGSISQSVVFPAGTFELTFSAAQRGNYQANFQTFRVLLDGQVIDTVNDFNGPFTFIPFVGEINEATNYTTMTTSSFTVASGSHTILFQGTNLNGGDNTILLSQVALTALPTSLDDSGFETPVLAAGAYQYDPSGSLWSFLGSAGLATNGSGFTQGNPSAPQGNQVAFIQGTGTVSQQVTMPAGTYDVTFNAAERATDLDGQSYEVLIDGNVVGSFYNASNGLSNPYTSYGTYTTNVFLVSSGSHSIVFQGTDTNGRDYTILLDQVAINPVSTGPSDAAFETPALASGTFAAKPAGSAWTFASSAGLAANGSAVTLRNPSAPQGNQVAFVQALGTISQTATFAAGTYQITFLAAQRANSQASFQTFEVLFDDAVVGIFDNLSGTSYTPLVTAPFTVSAGSHTIGFQGTDYQGGDNTVLLDQVAVNPVPLGPSDPNFEMPLVGSGNYQVDPVGSPWTFTGSAGVSGRNSGITSFNPVFNQAAFIQALGSISQSVTLPAGTYLISLNAAQRGNISGNAQTLEVLVDGKVVGVFNNVVGTDFTSLTTSPFTVNPGSRTITIQGTDLAGGDNTILVDGVAVDPFLLGPADEGFETPPLGEGAFQYDPAGSPWTFAGSAGLTGNGSDFTRVNANAPEGNQVAFVQATGSVRQNIPFPEGTYQISFLAAQRGNVAGNAETFEVLVGGNVVGTFNNLVGTSYTPLTTPTFSVGTGSHTVVFQGTDLGGGDNTVLLDQVAIQPVGLLDPSFEVPPEPEVGSISGASPWTFTGPGFFGLAGNGLGVTAGGPNAPEGGQVAVLYPEGGISQEFLMPAGTFDITFQAAQPRNEGEPISPPTLEVLLDGKVIGVFANVMNSLSYMTFTTSSFTVAAGSHTLLFRATGFNDAQNTLLLDQVAIKPIGPSDPGFEIPAFGAGEFQYDPATSPWTFRGSAGVAGNASAFTSGNPSAPHGDQVAFLQALGSISQSVALPAGVYQIAFSAAQRGNVPGNSQTFQVLVDGNVVGTFNSLTGTNYTMLTTASFTVAAGNHTIAFQGTDLGGGDNTVLLDQVAVNAVPIGPQDPNFTMPTVAPGAYEVAPTGSPWTFTGSAGITGYDSDFTKFNALGLAPPAQIAFIQALGSISQSVSLPAGTYAISLLAAQRGNNDVTSPQTFDMQTFQVLVDGNVVATFNNVMGGNFSTLTTPSFTVPAGSHTITIQGTDLHGGDNTVFIDQVLINPLGP